MSKTREPRNQSQSPTAPGGAEDDAALASDSAHFHPLKPQRALFVVLAIILVVLFAGMMGLYYKTVDHRGAPQAIERDTPAAIPTPAP